MEIIIRASLVYVLLFLIARGTGKRELSQMTVFELILLVTMGDLVQQGVTQEDMSVTGAALSVGTLAFWVLVVGGVTYRWKASRPLLEGVPVVVLHEGQPLMDALRLERVTLEELAEGARSHGIADLSTVHCAVLEPDGRFSFLTDDPSGPSAPGQEERRAT